MVVALVMLAALMVIAVLVVDRDDSPAVIDAHRPVEVEGVWAPLPDPPLTPRTDATVAWTGEEVLVVGGWEFLCPPNADCVGPTSAPFSDGAALDLTTETWRSVAEAPAGMRGVRPAVVDGVVFYLVDCSAVPSGFATSGEDPCPGWDDSTALLRYDPATDVWEQLPGPPADQTYSLEAAGRSLIAYSTTEELGEKPDWRFDLVSGIWQELPDDPLPALFDRSVVAIDGGRSVMLVGAELGPSSEPGDEVNLAARLDLETMTWRTLPSSPSRGFRAWGVGGTVVLEPHFGGTGGFFDPQTDTWSQLHAEARPHAPSPVAGVLGGHAAVFAGSSGRVLDLDTDRWLEIDPVDDRVPSSTSVTAAGRDLFLFGGERWAGSDGELLGDAWLWVAPSAG